jgi:hypothetical protein
MESVEYLRIRPRFTVSFLVTVAQAVTVLIRCRTVLPARASDARESQGRALKSCPLMQDDHSPKDKSAVDEAIRQRVQIDVRIGCQQRAFQHAVHVHRGCAHEDKREVALLRRAPSDATVQFQISTHVHGDGAP